MSSIYMKNGLKLRARDTSLYVEFYCTYSAPDMTESSVVHIIGGCCAFWAGPRLDLGTKRAIVPQKVASLPSALRRSHPRPPHVASSCTHAARTMVNAGRE